MKQIAISALLLGCAAFPALAHDYQSRAAILRSTLQEQVAILQDIACHIPNGDTDHGVLATCPYSQAANLMITLMDEVKPTDSNEEAERKYRLASRAFSLVNSSDFVDMTLDHLPSDAQKQRFNNALLKMTHVDGYLILIKENKTPRP